LHNNIVKASILKKQAEKIEFLLKRADTYFILNALTKAI